VRRPNSSGNGNTKDDLLVSTIKVKVKSTTAGDAADGKVNRGAIIKSTKSGKDKPNKSTGQHVMLKLQEKLKVADRLSQTNKSSLIYRGPQQIGRKGADVGKSEVMYASPIVTSSGKRSKSFIHRRGVPEAMGGGREDFVSPNSEKTPHHSPVPPLPHRGAHWNDLLSLSAGSYQSVLQSSVHPPPVSSPRRNFSPALPVPPPVPIPHAQGFGQNTNHHRGDLKISQYSKQSQYSDFGDDEEDHVLVSTIENLMDSKRKLLNLLSSRRNNF
jgi:hypothetical protein